MDKFYRQLLKYDDMWCYVMGFFNPYTDPFKLSFTKRLPMFDKRAFNQYPNYNFVYDKLWIAQSQDIVCGKPEDITATSHVNYPIFIKPRWGHMSASSKNCFKINSFDDLKKYKHLEEMMWSEYIEGIENMTDYLLLNGNIIYQISYQYSKSQNGFTECYKYISPDNQPPSHITDWVKQYMVGYSGVVNVQYRDDSIIEVGLRLARGGAYIQSTKNNELVDMINNIYDHNTYSFRPRDKLNFQPYYSFKCFTRMPILYLYPQYAIDVIMKFFNGKEFYEYYFEPNGNDGCVFFQFLHESKFTGQVCVQFLTYMMIFAQLFFISIVLIFIYILCMGKYKWLNWNIVLLIVGLYFTQYLNPISVHYNLYKAKRQKSFF